MKDVFGFGAVSGPMGAGEGKMSLLVKRKERSRSETKGPGARQPRDARAPKTQPRLRATAFTQPVEEGMEVWSSLVGRREVALLL
jgi:hypothetical protein